MRILDWFRKLFRRESVNSSTSTTTTSIVRSGGVSYIFPTTSNVAIATVYRCIQVLADSVAGLHLQYLRKTNNGVFQEYEQSPLHYLLTVEPQPEMSIYEFWAQCTRFILLAGNAYIYPRRVGGEVTDLVLCRPGTVSHDALNNLYTISDPWSGVYGTFKESEIIHLYLYSTDGRHGESVLMHARRTLAIANAGDEETGNRFINGGSVRGIVGNDKNLQGFGEYQDEELAKTAVSIDEKFQSGDKIVSLPGQVSFQQLSLSSTDMQFLETRKFTVEEICRFFGVPPFFVFADNSGNYKSVEMANNAFMSMTLDPILKRIEAEFTRKLIPRSMCCKRLFRFNRRDIYSLDLNSKADYQRKTIEAGIFTVNDWRRIENLPQVEGGDKVLVSANLKELNESIKPIEEGEGNN